MQETGTQKTKVPNHRETSRSIVCLSLFPTQDLRLSFFKGILMQI